jgi:hypothetical protein
MGGDTTKNPPESGLYIALTKGRELTDRHRRALKQVADTIEATGESQMFLAAFAVATADMRYWGERLVNEQEGEQSLKTDHSAKRFYMALRGMKDAHRHVIELDKIKAMAQVEAEDLSVIMAG